MLSNDWQYLLGEEFCSKVTDGTHDSPKQAEYGKPLITSKHIKGDEIDFDTAYLISEKDFNEINKRSQVEQWDVIISMIGAYCGFCFIERNEEIDYAVKNVGLFKTGSEINAKWLYYYLNSSIGKSHLDKVKGGSTQPYIALGSLRKLPILVPKNHQLKEDIVRVLDAIDSKIRVNNRINTELETMAKTLYDYWFVQFDFPDVNGKPYKASGGKMVYNDTLKREIPQDWKVNKLVEITSLIRRGISPKYTEESGTQVLNQKCIRNQKISFEDSRRHQAIMDDNDERLLKPFDVLVNSTGVGTLGRVAYVKRLAEKKTTVDSHVSIVRANPDKVCPRYLAWKLMRYQPVIEAAANGSTGQVELSKSFLEDLDVIIPSGSVAKKFSEFVEPIAISVAKRESENEQLISLRDWLLPMLMNSQVTVKPSTEAQEAQHG
ncbi:TPA: restriction endonuclease subunit S [Vibrio parahaemolyticus]|uniref:restriction endonuclease subunit S n=1 Tax=Vibrio vulnificus TaxID=672 RepID=UPI001A2CBA5D|nr:restriction endonuclease subunit S [Vibrio vulnificus]MDF4600112.1 restriction endonuclease subunit S [Vibrio parahaemolyticus]HAS6272146.1 restriction endonuclease subunit S [Vibrio vulnificus]HCG5110365.1 restriction endonuclease subunit S [Vibrio parahaemolyticus]HDY7428622.1 restriction endonuclease subunit S [Vibrio vulnificus]